MWHTKGVLDVVVTNVAKRSREYLMIQVWLRSLSDRWPKGRHCTHEIQDLIAGVPHLRMDVQDKVKWKGYGSVVKATTIWRSLAPEKPVRPWTKLSWYKGHILIHSFVCWVLCQGRLTRTRQTIL
ncbi:hypothetical protein LIER_10720 [Lithospermum erythrorhizon]|uniref:Reverse transcriptase zinc-binding domain-containing protein n=1 Tax=Lithospermum erythrorhizon TaxID=34254 RepID=A0AAV3PM24_LITER